MPFNLRKSIMLGRSKTIQDAQRQAEAISQERNKLVSKLDHKYPQAEIFVVEEANSNGSYNLVKESMKTFYSSNNNIPGFNDLGNGLYEDPGEASDVIHRINSVTSILPTTPLTKGDKVEVGYYNRSRQKPYIRRLLSRGIFNQVDAVDDDFETVGIIPGMWIQASAFFWNPNYNTLQPINKFDLRTPEDIEIVGQALAVQQIDFDTIILHFPSFVRFERPGKLILNGVDYLTPWPPTAGAFSIVGTGPSPALGINQSHHAIILDYIYNETDVWTSDYVQADTSGAYGGESVMNQLSEWDWNAIQSSLTFLGMVAYPEGPNQVIALLHPVYQDRFSDGEPYSTTYLYENEAIEERIFLDYPPDVADPPEYSVNNYNITTIPPGFDYPGEPKDLNGSLCFPLTPLSTNVDVYYMYKTGTFENHVEAREATGSQEFVFSVFEPTYAGGSTGDITYPEKVISSINSVYVDGILDPFVTFYDNTIVLSSPPDVGAYVEFDFEFELVSHQIDYMTESNYLGGPQFWPLTQVPFHLINVDIGGFSSPNNIYIPTGSSNMYILAYWSVGDYLELSYMAEGGLFLEGRDIATLRITERNIGTEQTQIYDIPIDPPIDANPIIPWYTEALTSGYFLEAPGFSLYYDPNTRGYTIAGPSGLIWRARRALEAPPTTPPNPAVNYTLAEWPEELDSDQDPPDGYAGPLRKKRPLPWLNFSACGSRAIQGGWDSITDDRGIASGEYTFTIRLWKRDSTTYTWEPITEINVRDLIESDSEDSLVVEATLANENADYLNSGWPMFRDQSAWLLIVKWRFEPTVDYFYNLRLTYGNTDSGLSFVAINPSTGAILDKFTIKGSQSEVIQIYADVEENLAEVPDRESIDIGIDKYVNDNPIYWPPLSGPNPAPPYWGGIMFSAVNGRFALYQDDSGLPWFIAHYAASIGGEKTVDRYLPPPPYLPIEGSAEAMGNLTVDDEGNIYAHITLPVWQQAQTQWTTRPFKSVISVGTWFVAASGAGESESSEIPPAASYYINIPIMDSEGNQIFAANVSQVLYNGTPVGFYYPGILGGTLQLLRFVTVPRGTPVVTGFNEETGRYIWSFPDVTYTVTATKTELNPDFSTQLIEEYPGAGPFDFPTFLGFQASPMPNRGLQVYDSVAQKAKVYTIVYKKYLLKLNWDGTSFSQVWSKDLTYYGNVPGAEFYDEELLEGTYPVGPGTLLGILKIGRCIFSLQVKHEVIPPISGTLQYAYLCIYADGPGDATLLHEIKLERSEGAFGPTVFKFIGNVDSEDREHVLVLYSRSGGLNSPYALQVHMKENLMDAPDVEFLDAVSNESSNNGGLVPLTDFNSRTMIQAGGYYYWLTSNGDLKRKAARPTEGP